MQVSFIIKLTELPPLNLRPQYYLLLLLLITMIANVYKKCFILTVLAYSFPIPSVAPVTTKDEI